MSIQQLCRGFNFYCAQLPHWPLQLLARFALAATFWRSAMTKVEGLQIDLFAGQFQLGWPQLSDNARFLFEYEYQLPLLSPTLAAYLATSAELLLPLLLLLGLGTRFAALGVLLMTLVIEIFVYPDAYPLHGVWALSALYLIKQGGGLLSCDYRLQSR